MSKPKHDERRQAAVLAAIQAFRRTFSEFNRTLAAAGDSGLSMADTMVLHFVAHTGQVTAGDLARFTGLTSGAVTSVVDRLEKAGYLTRQRAQDDRRVVLIQLKPSARQKLMASMLVAHDEIGAMFEGWSDDEIEALVSHLERLHLD